MTQKIDLKNLARLLHMNLLSMEVYAALLIHGELSRSQLEALIDKKNEDIGKSIDELLQRNLIVRIGNIQDEEVYEVLSFDLLQEEMDKQKTAVDELKKFVLSQSLKPEKLGVITFEGIEGIRNVYLEVLEEAFQTKQSIFALENNQDNSRIGNEFFDEYVKRRTDSKIKAYILCPYSKADKEYRKKCKGNYTDIRLVRNFPIEANINIVGNLVMSFAMNPPQGTLRRSRAEAQTWKEVFQKLWRGRG